MTVIDFRNSPSTKVNDFAGAEYFMFEGDGYCTSLAYMLEAFVRLTTNKKINNGYCRTIDGSYTHAFSYYDGTFIDAALKQQCPLNELERHPPPGWIYTLIKRASMLIYEEMPHELRANLFSQEARKNMEFMLSGNHQMVYRPDAKLDDVFSKFCYCLRNMSTDMDIRRDDFPWKSLYRAAYERSFKSDKAYFFTELDAPIRFIIPPGSTLEILNAGAANNLSKLLQNIYYGRTLTVLSLRLPAQSPLSISLPTSPWYISSEHHFTLWIDQHQQTSCAFEPDLHYIGMEHLKREFILKSESDVNVQIHIPFNVLWINSDFAEITTNIFTEVSRIK